METKNYIIVNYAQSLAGATTSVVNATMSLGENADINNATIKTINVLLESVRSQTVLLQQAIDNYVG